MKMQKLFLVGIMVAAVAVTGCNTFKGMGKDIEGAGKAIEKAAEQTQNAIKK